MVELISWAAASELGLSRYFTGLPCKHGHVAERLVSNRGCLDCANAKNRIWAKNNPEKARAKHDRWAKANPETKRASGRKSARKRKAQIAARLRQKYLENPQYYIDRAAKWTKANPEKAANKNRTRRAKVAGGGGKHTVEEIDDLFDRQKGRCGNPACRCKLARLGKGKFHIDHIIPITSGGSNYIRNIQLLCITCNHRKHAKHPIDFMREQGFLL